MLRTLFAITVAALSAHAASQPFGKIKNLVSFGDSFTGASYEYEII
jgi:hypothetical protein